MQYAILIDGGFAKRKLGAQNAPADAKKFKSLIVAICSHGSLADHHLHRAYYYDSQPLMSSHKKPLSGGRIEFAKQDVASRAQKLFNELRREPFMALRLGDLSFNGWAVRKGVLDKADGGEVVIKHDDLRPEINQKGVDMRIGMDIAALTLKRQAGIIVLVTGDSDFVPAMKFARREGAQVFLVHLGNKIKDQMREHSDLILDDLTLDDVPT